MKNKLYRVLRRQRLRRPIREPTPPKPPHPALEPPPLPQLPPSPRLRSRRVIATIIVAAVIAHVAEAIAACFCGPIGGLFGIDLYLVFIGFAFSTIATGLLIRGHALLPRSGGTVDRLRTPVAFWYNVLGFGIIGHVVVFLALARVMHPRPG